ncbi:MAG: Fe-S protein assembly co-chaperone HscB [Rickettsiaceae bacterium]|nr:Fe-S protein assembly co-chaperone HscB [Rickettsiaceae bacterium]
MNYFELFALKPQFQINLTQLEERYIELQKQIHPDSGQKTKDIEAYDLNQAYQTLKNDYLRACLLLKQNGVDLLDENQQSNVDKNFLLEILERNELIDELEDLGALERDIEEVRNQRSDCIESIDLAFRSGDKLRAVNYTIYLKYYDNLLAILNKKIQSCF